METIELPLLPVIDMNKLAPSMILQTIKIGTDEPKSVDAASVSLADTIIDALLDGRVPPLEFAVRRRLLNDALDIAMKDKRVQQLMVTEVEKYGKAGASALGAKITIMKRTNYQFSADPIWDEINKTELEPVKARLKAQELRIKSAVSNGHAVVDSNSGEILAQLVPAPQTESITVSFSKK